jgi:hypothetical protein
MCLWVVQIDVFFYVGIDGLFGVMKGFPWFESTRSEGATVYEGIK